MKKPPVSKHSKNILPQANTQLRIKLGYDFKDLSQKSLFSKILSSLLKLFFLMYSLISKIKHKLNAIYSAIGTGHQNKNDKTK